ncbi:SDR family NAD(P)-dependent oxidoreductase [Gordonia sp. (in: high G+C Gram-positive bacteria)]|uniref:SDR family NAD(P)-dependent oxidoreductase n=1 Tax=Gordonia sp. (in: high G+C Gram-positive bacteria) TaxID=84139 RepID=UPI003F97C10B
MALPTPTTSTRAVITGASSGIGEALAERLARRGHSLLLVARREDRLLSLAVRLRDLYAVDVDVLACDLGDRPARTELIDTISDIDVSILCLNAGFATYGSLHDLDPDREREEVEVNVVAVHELLLAVLPRLRARGSGAILITGSTAGNQPSPNNATYAATKAFANTLAESLHGELRGSEVTCTLLAPGPVRTEFAEVADLGRLERLLPSFAWVSAEQAAESAVRGMESGRRRVVPGPSAKLQNIGGQHSPRSISNPLLRRIYGDMR